MVAPAAAPGAHAHLLRSLVQDCIAKHLYSTAVFFADKLVSLTSYSPADVFLLAQVGHRWRLSPPSPLACKAAEVRMRTALGSALHLAGF